MAKITNIKELREFIVYLEDKYDLLNFKIDGVKPWQLIRLSLYYDLGIAANIMSKPHSSMTKKNKILNILNIIKSSIFKNPFLSKKTDIVIFPPARIKKAGDKQIDIYTHYFIEKMLKDKIDFIEIEHSHLGKHLKQKQKWRYHKDFILVIRDLFYKMIKLKNIDYNILAQLENEVKQKIGSNFNLTSKLIIASKKYKIEYSLYKRLLEQIEPKQIYLVVSYGGLGSLIKAAKDLNIEVLEFQHGTFSKYHFGYYYGEDKKDLEYFPNKFLVWNEYWKNLMNFPIEDTNIIIKPFAYLENKKNSYSQVKRIKNHAIVLSQGILGDKIASEILNNWEYFKQFDLKYKLHPGEYEIWKTYPSLVKLLEFNNVELIKDIDLYKLFSGCEYQIGVFSTALFEGVEFGCKTVLLNLPGIEYMNKFIKLNDNIKIIHD